MKEIERYKITSANGNSSNVTKCDDGHWVNYADIVDFIGGTHKTIHNLEKDNYELKDNLKYVTEGNIKLQARIKELESEIKNITHYAANQEELLQEKIVQANGLRINAEQKIKELESQSHINEIKAQGIEEAIKQVTIDCMYDEDPVIVLTRFGNYAEQLRTKHD